MSIPNIKLSAEELKSITALPIRPEEEIMLDNVAEIESLLLPLEPLALHRLCKMLPENSKILEIGSYQGGSTVAIGHAIAGTNKSLYCLDPWQGYLNQEDFVDIDKSKIKDDFVVFNNFLRNTSFIGENLRVLRGRSTSFAELLAGKEFDLIFIDGAHDYMSVRTDIIIAFSAIKAGGIICGHDHHSSAPGVMRAVSELIGSVPSIQTKHIIDQTTIWICVPEDPGYEYIKTVILGLFNAGNLAEALQKSKNAYLKYKTEDLANFISSLESAIHKNQ
jgi:predicted O-methyltransferase YrrM